MECYGIDTQKKDNIDRKNIHVFEKFSNRYNSILLHESGIIAKIMFSNRNIRRVPFMLSLLW